MRVALDGLSPAFGADGGTVLIQQKIVDETEIQAHLAAGWIVRAQYPRKRYDERPSGYATLEQVLISEYDFVIERAITGGA